MKNEEIILRIRELIKMFGVTQNDFADKISTDRSNFSKHLNGKLPISDSLINKIVVGLGVSKNWLKSGEGDIFYMQTTHTHSMRVSIPSDAIHNSGQQGAKIYDIDVTAGISGRELTFTSEKQIGVIDVPYINKNANIVKVSGDSMQPVICNGDLIAIRPVQNMNLLFWGQIYVIILDDYRMVKYIRKNSNPNMVTLKSENPAYDDIEIPKTEIRHLFIVENIIRIDNRL